MKLKIFLASGIIFICSQISAFAQFNPHSSTITYTEQYRPQIHFSPEAHWMNDYWMAGILELMPTASYKGKAI